MYESEVPQEVNEKHGDTQWEYLHYKTAAVEVEGVNWGGQVTTAV